MRIPPIIPKQTAITTVKAIRKGKNIVKEVAEKYYREYIVRETLYKEEEENIISSSSSSTLFRGTKVKRFENDDVEPIFLLKYYTIENVPYEIWSKIEPDWNKFCRNYEVLLNRYNKKE